MDQDEAWLAEGVALFAAGDLEAAEEVLRRIGVTSPLCRDALLELSQVMLAAGQPHEALRCVEEADNLDSDARSLFQWGMCLTKQPAEAVRRFEAAAAADPGMLDAHLMAGHCRRKLGDAQGALAAYDGALRVAPRHAPAMYAIAEVWLEQRDVGRAVAQLQQLLAIAPQDGPAIALMGDVAFLQGDMRRAAELYIKAESLNGSTATSLYRLGKCFLELEDAFQALKAFDRSLRKHDRLWEAHVQAARICEHEGWLLRAERYHSALTLSNEHRAEAMKGLARVEGGGDGPGAPDDGADYVLGAFTLPPPKPVVIPQAVVEPPSAPRQLNPASPTGALGAGSRALRPGAPRQRQPGGTGMLEDLQKRLRDKLANPENPQP